MPLSKNGFFMYMIASASVFILTLSNLIPNMLICTFIVCPSYGMILCMYYFKSPSPQAVQTGRLKAFQKRMVKSIFYPLIWVLVILSQLGAIATSAENCYGWKMGDRCRSKLDVVLKKERLPSGNVVPHWKLPEDYLFPGMVLAHVGLLAIAAKLTDKN